MRASILLLGVAGCAAPRTQQAPLASEAVPRATPTATSTTAPTSSAPTVVPSATAVPTTSKPPPSLVPSQPLVDPKTIVGYVRCRTVSDEAEGKLEAEVVSVTSEPMPSFGVVTWHVGLRSNRGGDAEIQVIAPPALPIPLLVGDRVRSRVSGGGGGPNRHYSVVVEALDGTLLLSINDQPEGWQVSRGKALGTTNEGSYTTTAFGAVFEHGATRLESKGKWARVEVDGVPHYFWGSGASRKLPPGKRPMPDYVGGWLDSAIVRAR